MRKRVSFIEEVEGVDCELTHEPCEWQDILKAKVGDKLVIAYLVQDTDYRDVDDLMSDCMGTLYSFHRHADRSDHSNGLEALGNNSDGEANLDAVWDKHEAEAIRRYIECVLSDHTDADTVINYEETQNYEPRDGETLAERARRYVTADAEEAYSWNYVSEVDTMHDVLEKMWSEPAYFPGDRDAQLLSCYDHGGQVWSLSGSGMQCRWDTSNKAGVWVPDECLKKELDDGAAQAAFAFVKNTNWIRGTGKSYQLVTVVWKDDYRNEVVSVEFSDDSSDLHAKAKTIAESMGTPTARQIAWGRAQLCEVYAKQFLETYNAIISGDVYGCVVETFDENGAQIDEDACWGFIGGDYAKETLKSEYFDPTCKGVQKQYEHDVLTQCDKQVELL